MSHLSIIINQDKNRLFNWIRDNTVAKILVIFSFVLLLLTIIFVEYKICSVYLIFANEYKPFGVAMSMYMLKIATFIIFFFSVVSSSLIAISTLYHNKSLKYYFTLPIKSEDIFFAKVIPNFITSTLIIWLLLPIFLAYNKYIFYTDWLLVKFILGTIVLSVVSQSLGIIIASGWCYFSNGNSERKRIFLIIISLIFLLFTFKILFPTNFFKVSDASNYTVFENEINNLPIASKIIPTNWFVELIIKGTNLWTIIDISFVLFCLISIVIAISEKEYFKIWSKSQNELYTIAGNSESKKKTKNYPLFIKKNKYSALIINDLLSILRGNGNINYILFLLTLVSILLYAIFRFEEVNVDNNNLNIWINSIAFVGVNFISLIFAIKFIFPIVSKEKKTAWFAFSIPLNRLQYIVQKIVLSKILSIPIILIAIIISYISKTTIYESLLLIFIYFGTTVSINIIQCLVGAIGPNFRESENLEASSTSTAGVSALILSILILIINTILYTKYMSGDVYWFKLMFLSISCELIIIIPLWLMSKYKIQRYDF